MRKLVIAVIGTIAWCSLAGGIMYGQRGAGTPAAGTAAAPAAPTDKAAYFSATDIQAIWKDEEAKQVINKRVLEGGSHSINIRIVLPTNAPLVHALSADTWVVMEGSATAVTGGELMEAKRNPNSDDMSGSSIKGGIEQPLKAGDILFVPPGVAHGFKDIKGFRAYLIRYPAK
jgi:mannose-6-phosphate isomerase-like protein (cupin superfamily)